MSPEVVCCGEVLIDNVSTVPGAPLDEAAFEMRPGGAPANVAVALARLGVAVGFMGGVAPDRLGRFLRAVLDAEGVDTTGLVDVPDTETRQAWVTLDHAGERRLARFTRERCADAGFSVGLVRASLIASARWFHFGGVTLLAEPSRLATLRAAAFAREAGLRVSFDPNWRDALCVDVQEAVEAMREAAGLAHVVKTAREELALLAPGGTPREALAAFGLDALAVTDGPQEVSWCTRTDEGRTTPPVVEVVDATGAGDAFTGALIEGLLGRRRMDEAVERACRAGALACTRLGAWDGLARREALETS